MRLTPAEGRRLWIHAQRLDRREPFGRGPAATTRAIEHLGYVQIDTIYVIERSHHHILFTRIPSYRREHLHAAQSVAKTVFEYWTHALAYVPTRDLRFFLSAMTRHRRSPGTWFASVSRRELDAVVKRVAEVGSLTIRDIDDDVLVDKDHAWASRKPSKRALQLGFFAGLLAVSERSGMIKSYAPFDRHFGWEAPPKPATEKEIAVYLVDRALRSQGVVSLDSICHLDATRKAAVREELDARVRKRALLPVDIVGHERVPHWMERDARERTPAPKEALVHILSPFDPLVIQRKRTHRFFDYAHRFEAYVPKEKRTFGYFALPVLIGDRIVAVLDLKTDRVARKMLVQQWTWAGGRGSPSLKRAIEEELDRFTRFQLAGSVRGTLSDRRTSTRG